jgi:hypothetical protein
MVPLINNNGICTKRGFNGSKETQERLISTIKTRCGCKELSLWNKPLMLKTFLRMCQAKDAPIQDWVK